METRGVLWPTTLEEAREAYRDAGLSAKTVVREVALELEMDRETYRERVTSTVVETARDAIFAGQLGVTLADREAFEAWREDRTVHCSGHPDAARVAWHEGPAGTVVAATYNDEPDAAVATLRRLAFGRLYKDVL